MNKHSFGDILLELRRESGLTQRDVADRLHISDKTLSSWEKSRTTPDLDSLPSIAELYGITVDELLRGVGTSHVDDKEFDEQAEREARKKLYGSFSQRCVLLGGLSIGGGCLFLIACMILMYTSAPLWVSILIMLLGIGGAIACYVLLFYFQREVEVEEGLILKEDFTENDRAFALALKHKTAKTVLATCIPYLVAAIIFLIVFVCVMDDVYTLHTGNMVIQYRINRATYTAVILINFALGAALGIFSYIYNMRAAIKSGGANLAAVKNNALFVLKIFLFSLIPAAVSAGLMAVTWLSALKVLEFPITVGIVLFTAILAATVAFDIILYFRKRKKCDYGFIR